MCGKRKLPMLLILVFIMMFLILTTISYASSDVNIWSKSFETIETTREMSPFWKVIGYSCRVEWLVITEKILLIINIILLALINKKIIDFKVKISMLIKNIISWGILYVIDLLVSYAYSIPPLGSEPIKLANIFELLVLLVNLIWQLYMLIYIIKQRIKAKTDKIKQDV